MFRALRGGAPAGLMVQQEMCLLGLFVTYGNLPQNSSSNRAGSRMPLVGPPDRVRELLPVRVSVRTNRTSGIRTRGGSVYDKRPIIITGMP